MPLLLIINSVLEKKEQFAILYKYVCRKSFMTFFIKQLARELEKRDIKFYIMTTFYLYFEIIASIVSTLNEFVRGKVCWGKEYGLIHC